MENLFYETLIEDFKIKELKYKYDKKIFTIKRKQVKFEAISKLDDNTPLYEAFDKGGPIKLKIKVGKDQQGKIVEADIYEIAEGQR